MEHTSATSVLTSLNLAKALALAKSGRMREAQSVLSPNGLVPESVPELHAFAVLVTHEGDLRKALRLWELLKQRDPAHAEADRMIAAIELWLERPSWYSFIIPGAGVIAAGVVILILVLAMSGPTPRPVATSPVEITRSPVATPSERLPVRQEPAPVFNIKPPAPERKKR